MQNPRIHSDFAASAAVPAYEVARLLYATSASMEAMGSILRYLPNNATATAPPPQRNEVEQEADSNLLTADDIRRGSVSHGAPSRDASEASEDLKLLMKTLRECKKQGRSPSEALKVLHGRNGLSTKEWTHLYVVHAHRIYSTASDMRGADHVASVEHSQLHADLAGVVSEQQAGRPEHITDTATESPPGSPSPQARTPSPSATPLDRQHASRTYNFRPHRVPHTSDGSGHRRAGLRELARAPTPPHCPTRRGRFTHYFTNEDETYLFRFIRWATIQYPSFTQTKIFDLLAEEAPHHSARSWMTFAHQKMKARRRHYKEVLKETSDNDEMSLDEQQNSAQDGQDDDVNDEMYEPGPPILPSDPGDAWYNSPDVLSMGGFKHPYTDADRRMMARYIASKGDIFEQGSQEERWHEFSLKFPQRSAKCWSCAYSKAHNYPVINSLVRMYKRQNRRRGENAAHLDRQEDPPKGKLPVAIIDLTRPSPPPMSVDGQDIIIL